MIPFPSLKIGRILGIDIEVNYTWFVIFFMVVISLSASYFPAFYPKQSMLANTIDGVITAIFFFASVIAHELSHSFVARLNRVSIKKITLFIFGGIAQMSSEPNNASAEFQMAVAGPISSLFLSGLFYLAFLLVGYLGLPTPFTAPFLWLSNINLVLALFNLLPGFPLDGGRVLRAALWQIFGDFRRATKIAARSGQGLAFLLIAIGLLGVVFLHQYDLAWFIFLGWFLNYAASLSYQQALLHHALSDVRVKEIMATDVLTVSPDLDLESLVNDYFLKYKFGRFPVVNGTELMGIITLHDVKEIPRENWAETRIKEVIVPLKPGLIVRPEDEANEALMRMAKEEVGHLLVVEKGILAGMVTKSDIIRLIRVKSELGV